MSLSSGRKLSLGSLNQNMVLCLVRTVSSQLCFWLSLQMSLQIHFLVEASANIPL